MGSRRRYYKVVGLATGVFLANVAACLPKDYWYDFAAAGRTEILSSFADAVFGTITDTLFPSTADDEETDT